jgi:hypothetical protein
MPAHGALRRSALGKADQHQIAVGQAAGRQLLVEKTVEDRPRHAQTRQHGVGRAVLQAEPLPADRRHVAGERGIGRQEFGVGQGFGEIGRQPDQIMAVGPQTMQQHHQLLRRLARSGRHCGTVQRRHARLSPV